jgi:hypothetical protein
MKISDELDLIAKRNNGILRPKDVVEYARNAKTALHSKFTWDDTKAAEEYRLWQAREVIRVTVIELPGNSDPIRAFVSLTDDRQNDDGGYRYLVDILADPTRRNQLLREAMEDFRRWKNKYDRLAELEPIFKAAKKVRKAS